MKSKIIISLLLTTMILIIPGCKKSTGETNNDNNDNGGNGQGIGDTIKSFTENDQNGNTFSLDTFKGKVILLNISAMWCGPCREEAPKLMELYNTYKERGLEIVQCIYQDENSLRSDQSDLQRWVKEFKISFTVVNDIDGSLTGYFSFGGIPFNVIIGRDFKIKYRREGFYEEEIIQKIEDLL